MGLNTTVVVLNDGLSFIKENPVEFVDNLYDAIMRLRNDPIWVPCGSHCNVAEVVETHHADHTVVISVGGNCGSILGYSFGFKHRDEESKVRILKSLATEMGYRLVKNPKKEKS